MLPGGGFETVTGGAQQSLDVALHQETRFLARYKALTAAAVERFDVRGSDLSALMVGCIEHDNVIRTRRRDQFFGRVPAAVFALTENIAAQTEHDMVDTGDDSHQK